MNAVRRLTGCRRCAPFGICVCPPVEFLDAPAPELDADPDADLYDPRTA